VPITAPWASVATKVALGDSTQIRRISASPLSGANE
jgi:hypothetical protein